jgi:hypothetical protein
MNECFLVREYHYDLSRLGANTIPNPMPSSKEYLVDTDGRHFFYWLYSLLKPESFMEGKKGKVRPICFEKRNQQPVVASFSQPSCIQYCQKTDYSDILYRLASALRPFTIYFLLCPQLIAR